MVQQAHHPEQSRRTNPNGRNAKFKKLRLAIKAEGEKRGVLGVESESGGGVELVDKGADEKGM
jgi:hypothetical protein